MGRRIDRILATQHGAIERSQALVYVSRQQIERYVASNQWLHAAPRVYRSATHRRTWEQRLWVALLWAGDGAVLSHRSAGALWGLDRIDEGRVIVTVPTSRRLRSGTALVRRSDLVDGDRRVHRGFAVTSPERTLVDLAHDVRRPVLDDVLESAFRLGLTTPDRLLSYVKAQSAPGRRGLAPARAVLEGRTAGRPHGSVLEGKFLRLVRAAGLPEPVRQHEVVHGARRYFLDFAYPIRHVAIEIDGVDSHSSRTAFHDDRRRQNDLVGAGWTPLRFTRVMIEQHPDETIARLHAVLSTAA